MIQKYTDSSLGAEFMLSTENDVFGILQKVSKDHLKFIWNDGCLGRLFFYAYSCINIEHSEKDA